MINPVSNASREKGITRHKSGIVLNAGESVQYDESDPDIKAVLRQYWVCNFFQVINNTGADVLIIPDYAESRGIPCLAGSVVSRDPDEEMFTTLEIKNISSVAIAATDSFYLELGNRRMTLTGGRDLGRRK